MQAVANVKEIEKKQKKELSKEIFSKLRDISPFLHRPIRMQYALFTEKERKGKYDLCSTVGKSICCYSSCWSTEGHLLDALILRKCVKI